MGGHNSKRANAAIEAVKLLKPSFGISQNLGAQSSGFEGDSGLVTQNGESRIARFQN